MREERKVKEGEGRKGLRKKGIDERLNGRM